MVCRTCDITVPDARRRLCDCGRPLRDTDSGDPLVGTTLAGQFELAALLGEGGFGRVYLAGNVALDGRPCVVKVARPDLAQSPGFKDRFEKERRATVRLPGQHTVSILAAGTERENWYLVLEYLDGRTLQDVMRESAGPLPLPRVLSILRSIALGLEEAHANRLIHRDLKPSNVVFTDRRREEALKVIDFGIASFLAGEGLPVTASRDALGTLHYMAPEQVQGGRLDARVDLYALGAIGYEMLAGFAPFEDLVKPGDFGTEWAWRLNFAMRKSTEDPTPIAAAASVPVPGSVDALIASLLQRDPGRRPGSAAAVIRSIDRILSPRDARPNALTSPEGPDDRATGPWSPEWPDGGAAADTDVVAPEPWRVPWWLVAVAAGVCVGILAALLSLGAGESPDQPATAAPAAAPESPASAPSDPSPSPFPVATPESAAPAPPAASPAPVRTPPAPSQ
ncbi:MAG: serine/threonine protein kinase, partial [Deltaproteobacteria bacterium]|nr:serine/threonine protein kinase [Deltaproteobacteria bacterium]